MWTVKILYADSRVLPVAPSLIWPIIKTSERTFFSHNSALFIFTGFSLPPYRPGTR